MEYQEVRPQLYCVECKSLIVLSWRKEALGHYRFVKQGNLKGHARCVVSFEVGRELYQERSRLAYVRN